MPGTTTSDGPHGATVAPLPERIDALNYSLDPWERTGASCRLKLPTRGATVTYLELESCFL